MAGSGAATGDSYSARFQPNYGRNPAAVGPALESDQRFDRAEDGNRAPTAVLLAPDFRPDSGRNPTRPRLDSDRTAARIRPAPTCRGQAGGDGERKLLCILIYCARCVSDG